MRRNLIAQLQLHAADDDYSLAQLARAIAVAPRADNAPISRAFVRTRAHKFVTEHRTQRIRIHAAAALHA